MAAFSRSGSPQTVSMVRSLKSSLPLGYSARCPSISALVQKWPFHRQYSMTLMLVAIVIAFASEEDCRINKHHVLHDLVDSLWDVVARYHLHQSHNSKQRRWWRRCKSAAPTNLNSNRPAIYMSRSSINAKSAFPDSLAS
jgi:hypothetical protein